MQVCRYVDNGSFVLLTLSFFLRSVGYVAFRLFPPQFYLPIASFVMFSSFFMTTGEMCNFIAMACMRQESKATGADARAKEEAGFDATALELLKKAEILTERHPIVRAVTFNNMGCYFRKKGKLRTALSYVEKAIQIESQFQDGVKAADTHLNACTILSGMFHFLMCLFIYTRLYVCVHVYMRLCRFTTSPVSSHALTIRPCPFSLPPHPFFSPSYPLTSLLPRAAPSRGSVASCKH